MKKSVVFVLLIMASIVHADPFVISIIIPDGYKLNVESPNYVSLGIMDASTDSIDVAPSMDGPWLEIEVIDSSSRVELASLKTDTLDAITMHVAGTDAINSVELWLVLCDAVDESLCVFVETRIEVSEAQHEAGEVTIFPSPGEY